MIANYRSAARACACALMPAGVLWQSALARVLYGPDGFHPSRLGTYAAAVMVFSRLTGVPPVGLPRLGLNARQVLRIQRAAAVALKTASF